MDSVFIESILIEKVLHLVRVNYNAMVLEMPGYPFEEGGEMVSINKSDIKQFTSLGKSMMTERLEGSMTSQGMSDLFVLLTE